MPPVAHKYEVGTRLFCFEPDPSKAKLIYQAKVTQLCGFTNSGRSRVPLYFVHFLGWKQKWDREVSEDLLMDINNFTKMLKQKVDDLAFNIKDKDKRKERIDTVLMSAAKSCDDVDWDTLPGTLQKDERPTKARASTSSPGLSQSNSLEEIGTDAESLTQSNFEALEAHTNFAPKIKLPDTLYSILESHCQPYEASRVSPAKLLSLRPSWCSVLHLLQTYLNGFPYFAHSNNSMSVNKCNMNLFPSTVFRERFSKAAATAYAKTDRSRPLCAEFCCSVRILFDALLEEYLLYPCEEKRHSTTAIYKVELPPRGQFTILPSEELAKNPLMPCFVYDAVYILRLIVRLPALIDQMPLTKCRRSVVLRHLYLFIAYLDATRDFWFTATQPAFAVPVLPISFVSTSADVTAASNGTKYGEVHAGSFTPPMASSTPAVAPPTIGSAPTKRRRIATSEPASKVSSPPPPSSASRRKLLANQRRTSLNQRRSLRSSGTPIPVTATTFSFPKQNGKSTTPKTSRPPLFKQRALSSMSSSAKPQRRLTRSSVSSRILRSARV